MLGEDSDIHPLPVLSQIQTADTSINNNQAMGLRNLSATSHLVGVTVETSGVSIGSATSAAAPGPRRRQGPGAGARPPGARFICFNHLTDQAAIWDRR